MTEQNIDPDTFAEIEAHKELSVKIEALTDENNIVKLPLEAPFKYGDETITEVEIPRVRAVHMRGINGKKVESGDMDELLKLVQKLLFKPTKYIDSLDMVDVMTIGEVVGYFLSNGPKAGGTA